MTEKVCLTCKPTKSVEADKLLVTKIGCDEDYSYLQSCMDKHTGNIASCRE